MLPLLLPLVVNAVFFYVSQESDKCFIQQLPPGVLVSAKYNVLDELASPCVVEFRRKSKSLFQKVVDKNSQSGTASYHSDSQGGDIQICINCKQSKRSWYDSLHARNKWQLQIETRTTNDVFGPADAGGYMPPIGPQTAVSDKLSKVEKEIRAVLNTLEMIEVESEYEKKQEMTYRDTSEATNSATMSLSIFAILCVLLVFGYQAFTLRNFFRSQKLI